jgi:hypothetical protein
MPVLVSEGNSFASSKDDPPRIKPATTIAGLMYLDCTTGVDRHAITPAILPNAACVFFAPEGVAPTFVLSAIFWFGVGAAARVRRAWLIVVMVIVLFIAMMVLGLALAIVAMMQSSP